MSVCSLNDKAFNLSYVDLLYLVFAVEPLCAIFRFLFRAERDVSQHLKSIFHFEGFLICVWFLGGLQDLCVCYEWKVLGIRILPSATVSVQFGDF